MGEPAVDAQIDRFEQYGFGLFLHWGLYAQLGQGEWILELGDVNQAEYESLTETFTAETGTGRRSPALRARLE